MFKKKKKADELVNTAPYTKGILLVQIIMTVLAILFVAPIFIILNYSFKTKKELYLNSPLSLPESLNFENYIKAFEYSFVHSSKRIDFSCVVRNNSLGYCQM